MERRVLDLPLVEDLDVVQVVHVENRESGAVPQLADVGVRTRHLLLEVRVTDAEVPTEGNVRDQVHVRTAADLLEQRRAGGGGVARVLRVGRDSSRQEQPRARNR
jgi:hypothetical protein